MHFKVYDIAILACRGPRNFFESYDVVLVNQKEEASHHYWKPMAEASFLLILHIQAPTLTSLQGD